MKTEEDLKKKVIQINKAIDECANKTDIWDNERWNKFRRLLRGEIKIIFSNEEDVSNSENFDDGLTQVAPEGDNRGKGE